MASRAVVQFKSGGIAISKAIDQALPDRLGSRSQPRLFPRHELAGLAALGRFAACPRSYGQLSVAERTSYTSLHSVSGNHLKRHSPPTALSPNR